MFLIAERNGTIYFTLSPHFPARSLLCQVPQTGHPKSNTLLHCLIEALDFPYISVSAEARRKLIASRHFFFFSLCDAQRAPGLADHEDGQGDRHGVYAYDGVGGAATPDSALCLIGFLPFPLY